MTTREKVMAGGLVAIAVVAAYFSGSNFHSSKKKRKFRQEDSTYALYVLNGQPVGAAVKRVITDTNTVDPEDSDKVITVRDTFYLLSDFQFHYKDSAGKKVVTYLDSARTRPRLDTTYYWLDKFFILHDYQKNLGRFIRPKFTK